MEGYQEVRCQAEMDHLVATMGRFHDSLTKEFRVANRGYVDTERSLLGGRFDALLVIQSQWEPGAVEILFSGVEEFTLGSSSQHWDGVGHVRRQSPATESIVIEFLLEGGLRVVADKMFYRVREDWLGPGPFLGDEVPQVGAPPARDLGDGWRQCSACAEAWRAKPSERYSRCIGCGRLTELTPDIR